MRPCSRGVDAPRFGSLVDETVSLIRPSYGRARSLERLRVTLARMPVSRELRMMFVHIPKCGGSSIERAFGMHGDYRVEDREHLYGRAMSEDLRSIAGSTNYLQHLDVVRLRRALVVNGISQSDLARFRTFAFVRNPFDRLVSAWAGGDPDLRACALEAGIDLRGLSFSRFVDATISLDHPHVAPQTPFICAPDGALRVDFVGRFERLADDFGRLCDQFGLALAVRPKLPHAHRSHHPRYQELFDVRSRTLAMRRYREDLAVLGYDY